MACDQIPAMQKRVITPYPDAPDLRPYEEEDSESVVFSPKTQSELEPSCRLAPLETLISCTAKIFIWLPSLITDQVFLVKKRCNGGSPEENAFPHRETLFKKAKVKAKKKPRRRSESSGGYTISDRIQCPPVAGMINTSHLKLDWWLGCR